MLELIKNTKIDFLGRRNYAFLFSGILVAIGLLAIIQIARGEANLGIDFMGGTSVLLKFEKPVNLSQVRSSLDKGGLKNFELQDFPYIDEVLVKVKRTDLPMGEAASRVTSAISASFPDNKFLVEGTTEIGPTVGSKLRRDAIIAITLAIIGILIYIAWRFQFSFGIGATVATFHDVLAVLGVFYLLGREINLIVVTALLTLAGYSLTDTVVVFDRIRENIKFLTKEPLDKVMNKSINEVLSRTIVTSATVLLVTLALFFFGGEVIHDFALAMLLGVIVGTYSSVFVASPIVYLWKRNKPLKKV